MCACVCRYSISKFQNEGFEEKHAKEQLDSCTFMALANSILLFSKPEQGLLSIGREIIRNVFQVQTPLFFPKNNFSYMYVGIILYIQICGISSVSH